MSMLFFHGRRETWSERAALHRQDAQDLAARDAEERMRFAGQPEQVKHRYRTAQLCMAVCIPLWTVCAVISVWTALALALLCGLIAALKIKDPGFPGIIPLITMLTGTAFGVWLVRPLIMEFIYGR